jgi:hypothetical protein
MKPFWQSKTILVNLLMALAVIAGTFYPPVGEWIKANLNEAAPAWAVINIVLRAISKDGISIS